MCVLQLMSDLFLLVFPSLIFPPHLLNLSPPTASHVHVQSHYGAPFLHISPLFHSSSRIQAHSPRSNQIVKKAFRKDADSYHIHQELEGPMSVVPVHKQEPCKSAMTISCSLWPDRSWKWDLPTLRPGLWAPVPSVPPLRGERIEVAFPGSKLCRSPAQARTWCLFITNLKSQWAQGINTILCLRS